MKLERIRHDLPTVSQFTDMDEWLLDADHDDIERLLSGSLDILSNDDQQFLGQIWSACESLNKGYCDHEAGVTYHWTRKDSEQLRQEVSEAQPGYLDADPRQESLF